MQTGSGENNPAKNNHMLRIFKNLPNQIVFKGKLSWRARVSFQAEWLLGEGIMLVTPWHLCFFTDPGRTQRQADPVWSWGGLQPRQVVVLGLRRICQHLEFHPGLDGCSRLMGATDGMAVVWQWPRGTAAFILNTPMALSPGQCLTVKGGFVCLKFYCDLWNSLVYN